MLHDRIFKVLGGLLAVSLTAAALFAAEHHGVVKANGLPVPGATVTASAEGQKTQVTTTDDNGAYAFAELPDGIWSITVEMLGFAKLTREVGVANDSPSPTWELKVQSLSDLNAQLAAAKKGSETATSTPAAPAPPTATAENKAATPAVSPTTPTKPAATTNAQQAGGNGRGGRGTNSNNGRPSLQEALNQQRNGGGNNGGNNGFQRVDVNAAGNGQSQDNSSGTDNPANADLAQSSSDAFVVGGSVNDALGMPQQNDWGFGGRGGDMAMMGPGFGGPGGPGGFGQPGDPNAQGGPGGGRGGPGGGGPGFGGRGGGGGMMMGGGPGGFGGRGGRGGGGPGGGRGGRGGRGNTNSFGNGRRNPRSQYNGNVMFTLDNSVWDATPASVTGIDAGKPAYAKFRAGFTLGGPLKIPHLFDDSSKGGTFTITYNLNRSRSDNTVFGAVPTLDERNGDLSQALSSTTGAPVVFYNPLSGNPDGTGRSPFPGNIIPSNLINPAALTLLSYYPFPNLQGNARYNYQAALRSITNTDNITSRFSHSFNQKNQINGGVGWQRSNGASPTSIFNFGASAGLSSIDSTNSSGINANVAYQHRFTVRIFNRLSYSFSRSTNTALPFFAANTGLASSLVSELGIGGTIAGSPQANPLYYGPPSINLQNFYDLSDGSPSLQRNQTSSIGDALTWIRGTHNMTFGADTRFQQFNPVNESNARGAFTYNNAATAQYTLVCSPNNPSQCTPTAVQGTGYDLADFLLGYPDTSSVAYGNADKYFRTKWWDVYANDDWRVTTKFSLQFGLRWDYAQPFTEEQGRLVNLAITPGFTTASPICATAALANECTPASSLGLPSSLLRPDKRGVAPRFGLAYRPWVKHTTVIRGGYGLYWNTSFYQSIVNQMAQESPLSTSFSVSNTLTNPYTMQNVLSNGTGVAAANGTALQNFAVNPDFRNGYSQNWQLAIQQNVTPSTLISVTYAGVKGTDLPQMFVPNTFPLGVTTPTYLLTGYKYETTGGNSSYQAGTITFQRRLRNGIGGNISYTRSKLIDDAALGGRGQGTPPLAQNWLDLSAERGLDASNRSNTLSMGLQLSSGQGLHAAALLRGWKAHLLKDWTVLTNVSLASGSPETPILTATTARTGITGQLRPEVIAPLYPATPGYAFNINAFETPEGYFGDAGRGIITGPSLFTMNGSASRTFRIAERKNLDIRFDATNLLNHPYYTGYNMSVGTTQFGLPTGIAGTRSFNMTARFHF